MSITLRPMTDADIPPIVEWMLTVPLWQRYGLQREKTMANFRTAINRGDVLLAAEADAQAVGFAWCLRDGTFGFAPYLKLIGVHPEKHGQNIGGQLLDALEAILQDEGYHDLFLLVADFNDAAQRFYQKHGYRQIGAIPHLVLDDVAEFIFWKAL